MSERTVETRDRYFHFLPIQTRWNDNDVYGHVNNMVYYGYFDSVVSGFLVTHGGLDIEKAPVVGVVVESMCRYHHPLSFPEVIDAGLRVGRLGRSSVRYEVGIFRQGAVEAAADGHFVHVFVDRETMRPAGIPDALRSALTPLVSGG